MFCTEIEYAHSAQWGILSKAKLKWQQHENQSSIASNNLWFRPCWSVNKCMTPKIGQWPCGFLFTVTFPSSPLFTENMRLTSFATNFNQAFLCPFNFTRKKCCLCHWRHLATAQNKLFEMEKILSDVFWLFGNGLLFKETEEKNIVELGEHKLISHRAVVKLRHGRAHRICDI